MKEDMKVVVDESERQQCDGKSLVELIGDEKIHHRTCSNNGEHEALCLISSTTKTQALFVLDHGSLPSNDETTKFIHEFATFGTLSPLRNVLVAHFPDANIVSMKFWNVLGTSEEFLLVVDSKGRAFIWRYAVSLSLWTIVTTFLLLQGNEENDLILAMEYEEKSSTMLWIVHRNSIPATLCVCLVHLMISSTMSTHPRSVTVTSSAMQSAMQSYNKTNHHVLLIGPSVILSLPASEQQTSLLFSGCGANGIWMVMNTITAATAATSVYFYDCSKAALLSISLPPLLNDSKLRFSTEDTLGPGSRYHPTVRITNESLGQPLYIVMMINDKLSIITAVSNDDTDAGLMLVERRDTGHDLVNSHVSLSSSKNDDDGYALSEEFLRSLIDGDGVDDADNIIYTGTPSYTINPSSSVWSSATSAVIPEISLSRSLFMESSEKSGVKFMTDTRISASTMQLISSRASDVIRHLCASRDEIEPSQATTVSTSTSASIIAAKSAVAAAAVLLDSTINEEKVEVVQGALSEGVCKGSWIEEIDLIYLTPLRDPSFVLCKHTHNSHHHPNNNHNNGILEPFELILISTLVRDMTDDANPQQATCRSVTVKHPSGINLQPIYS